MKHPVIDAPKLALAMVKANLTQQALEQALHSQGRFTQWAWSKMLTGMKPNPRHWTVICNLLGVPLNAFDLPAAGEGEQAGPGNRGLRAHLGDHYASGESEALAALRQSLRAMGFPDADDDASPRPLPIRNEDTARSALPGLLANLGQCLLCILPRTALPPVLPQAQEGAASAESARQRGKTPGAAASIRRPSPHQTKTQNRARRVSSPKPATPPVAKQAGPRTKPSPA